MEQLEMVINVYFIPQINSNVTEIPQLNMLTCMYKNLDTWLVLESTRIRKEFIYDSAT